MADKSSRYADKQSRGLGEGKANEFGKVTAGPSEYFMEKAKDESSKNIGDLTVKIDVDVSEALIGLKAVTREAKTAQKALRELETYYTENDKRYYVNWRQQGGESTDIDEICMSDIPTKYLSRELAKREGVGVVEIDTADIKAIELTVDLRVV